jgi:MFS family permease
MTRFTQRLNTRHVMTCGYLLLGGGFAFNAVAVGFGGLFIGMSVFTLGEMLTLPMSNAYVARIAPEHMRGRYIGTLGMAWSASGIIGPQIGLALFGISHTAAWLACGMFGIIAAFIINRYGNGHGH